MILLAIILLTIITTAMFSLAVLEGRAVYRAHRSEKANLERQKRWAERRLHDLSSKAFESMLDEARRYSNTQTPRSRP
jgi:hypothetical protein